jgi:3-deoxy-D-manno-octulosonic-acid transferase
MVFFVYKIYALITALIHPLLIVFLRIRLKKGKEDELRWREKLGIYSRKRPDGKLIWLHVASVGEMNSISKLIAILSQNANVLVTSGTLTSAKNFNAFKGEKYEVFHQFAPLDSIIAVKRFLAHFKPDCSAILESEIWLNTIYEASKVSKIFSINTSFSPKSLEKWKKAHKLFKWVLGRFSGIFPSSKIIAKELSLLGVKNLHFIGHLKYDANFKASELDIDTLGKKIVCFASIHPVEDLAIMEAVKMVISRNDCLCILIPRHLEKIPEITNNLAQNAVKYNFLTPTTGEVYVVDKMGKSLSFYAKSDVVFIGGSLAPIGGHNIIEPAFFGKAVIIGKHHFKCKEVVDDFKAENAVLVATKENLKNIILELLDDDKKREEIGNNALEFVKKHQEVSKFIASFLQ